MPMFEEKAFKPKGPLCIVAGPYQLRFSFPVASYQLLHVCIEVCTVGYSTVHHFCSNTGIQERFHRPDFVVLYCFYFSCAYFLSNRVLCELSILEAECVFFSTGL